MNLETIRMMLSSFTDDELAAALLDRSLGVDKDITEEAVFRLLEIARTFDS